MPSRIQYTPTASDRTPLPLREGDRYGCFALVRTDGQWQLDHVPTGFRCLPSAAFPTEHLPLNRLRRLASLLSKEPAFTTLTGRPLRGSEQHRLALSAVYRALDETR